MSWLTADCLIYYFGIVIIYKNVGFVKTKVFCVSNIEKLTSGGQLAQCMFNDENKKIYISSVNLRFFFYCL